MLYVGALSDAVSATVLNTDDAPRFEYLAARSNARARAVFRLSSWPALVNRLLAASQTATAPVRRPRGSAAASHAMARAQQLVVGQEQPRWQEAAALLRRNVAEELLEVPDRTVAEAWPTSLKSAAPPAGP
jgi:hypothetical protein